MSQELLAEVKRDDGTAKTQLHVTGVPFFLISAGDSQKIALSGALGGGSEWRGLEQGRRLHEECARDPGLAASRLPPPPPPPIVLAGAQPPEAFQEAVQLALKQAGSSGGAAAAGTACGPGTGCA